MRFIAFFLVAMLVMQEPLSAEEKSPQQIADWIQACRPDIPRQTAMRYARIIDQASKKHGVDPALAVALISVESNFNPKEVSHAGAVGLTQVMPFRQRLERWQVSRGGLMRPEVNIDKGLELYAGFKSRARGDRERALNMYLGKPKASSTRYSKIVTKRAKNLKRGDHHLIGKELPPKKR